MVSIHVFYISNCRNVTYLNVTGGPVRVLLCPMETYPLMLQQGTGKTSTISKAVQEWESRGNTVWIAAQSNVAVKNIAERLIRDKVEFRILVSKEFHFEW
jgi:hypothetical protein